MPKKSVSSKKFSVSVVICCYTEKRWAEIMHAVESVQGQTQTPDKLIIITDYNDHLHNKLKEALPNVSIYKNTQVQGLSGARNTAIEKLDTDLIAFLDDDAYANPNWLELLMRHYDDTDVVATGGITYPDWETKNPQWFPKEFYWTIGCSYRGLPESVSSVRNLFGGNMTIKRRLIADLGGYNTNLGRLLSIPLGGEETELCIRIHENHSKAKMIYDPEAAISHLVTKERISLRYFLHRCFAEGLSKAQITRLSKSKKNLSSEQAYTFSVLPLAFLRGFQESLQGDGFGIIRSIMISLGLISTVLGFLIGKASFNKKQPSSLTGAFPSN